MGSPIEINDTLQITVEQGFPAELKLEEHCKNPYTIEAFKDRMFAFKKSDERLYHRAPTRVFLVQNIKGKWLYWGHAVIHTLTIDSTDHSTSGTYTIVKLYDPAYQRLATINETPEGKPYF